MTAAEEEKFNNMLKEHEEKLSTVETELTQKYEECEKQRKELEEKGLLLAEKLTKQKAKVEALEE
jgi:hypothetical protein